MEKEDKLTPKVAIVAILMLLVNFGIFSSYLIRSPLTGYSIVGKSVEVYNDIPSTSRWFFIGQIFLIIFLLLFALFRDFRFFKRVQGLSLSEVKGSKSGETDIDRLYKLLQEKKQIRIYSIPKAFHISREAAMEWCKTLETGGLATVDYPTVGSPILRIN